MDKRPLSREEILANKRVVKQVRFQRRFSATKEDSTRNIDRMMRGNRSLCG